jgi:hypothetical protein
MHLTGHGVLPHATAFWFLVKENVSLGAAAEMHREAGLQATPVVPHTAEHACWTLLTLLSCFSMPLLQVPGALGSLIDLMGAADRRRSSLATSELAAQILLDIALLPEAPRRVADEPGLVASLVKVRGVPNWA